MGLSQCPVCSDAGGGTLVLKWLFSKGWVWLSEGKSVLNMPRQFGEALSASNKPGEEKGVERATAAKGDNPVLCPTVGSRLC